MQRYIREGTYVPIILFSVILTTCAFQVNHRPLTPYGAIYGQAEGVKVPNLGPIVKGNKVQADGYVVECRGGTSYVVQIANSYKTVLCELGGTLYRKRKLLTINTKVKIEMHIFAPDRGRIVQRLDSLEELLSASKVKR
ncbi:putative integral membrane protein [Babesia bovis T2Bo]|uniref:putative integral membrane protein n=1 Tax=Babesia bovis T2Bo TaxID=484906 RepID=UPI001C345231|nr:putative integral membrane protein [Babesia bovis T2Bo]KAG6440158.1 putative integral membrane protein [Babesia bovis T2Bo]